MPNHVWLKQGVRGHLSPEMRRVKSRLVSLYFQKGLDFYITSIEEGQHHHSSCHYEGCAIDFKRQGISKSRIQLAAGSLCDVVEYGDLDIFHVEYDPKT